jgi:hypothetical protein
MAAASEIRDRHAHCIPHLARLHMLGRHQPGEPLPPGLADEVSEATSAILAEADAALRATVAAVPGARRRAVAGFLADRVARLAATADEAVSAAKDGDAAAVRRCLRRFEVLTSAVWTVQLAMPDKTRPLRPARGPQRPQSLLPHPRQQAGALALDEAPAPLYDPAAPGRKRHGQPCFSWTMATGQGE